MIGGADRGGGAMTPGVIVGRGALDKIVGLGPPIVLTIPVLTVLIDSFPFESLWTYSPWPGLCHEMPPAGSFGSL